MLIDDSGKACITDFGLSKVCSSGAPGNMTSRIAGTLRFLAPEALKGQPLSFETDVYAFGMVIYEVLTIVDHTSLSDMTSIGICWRGPIYR